MKRGRMHQAIVAAALVLPLPWAACAQTDAAGTAFTALASEWQTLRPLRGHFNGAPWNDAVDRWQGRKHVVMQQLAGLALRQGVPVEQLERLMGVPDERLTTGSEGRAGVVRQAQWQGVPAGELWMYRWRGTHDQLVFAINGGKVVATGWVLALE